MKPLTPILVAILALAAAPRMSAQVPNSGLALSIVQARQANAKLLQQYSWNCRTEVLENGAVKDTRIDQNVYGPGGQVQRTLLNDAGAPLPHGFLRKRIAEKERKDAEKYLKEVQTLLDKYTLPTAGAVVNFLSSATIPPPGPGGELQITGGSVVVPGDTLSLWIYAPTRATRKVSIITFDSEGDQVTATATFKTLSSGLNYLQYATVDVPAKNLSVQIHNYDYINQNN
jgi:hypothetical protein